MTLILTGNGKAHYSRAYISWDVLYMLCTLEQHAMPRVYLPDTVGR